MALTGIAFQLRPKHRAIQNPSFIYFFSSSTSDSNVEDQNTPSSSPSHSQSQSSLYSYFSDVKPSLKQQQSPQKKYRQQPRKCSLSSPQTPSEVASLEDIRKNHSGFRRRSTVPTPEDKSSSSSPPLPPSQPISFQELYKRNVISKGENSTNEASIGGRYAIRESLKQHRSNAGKKSERTSPSSAATPLPFRPSVDGIMTFKDLRESLIKLKFPDYEKTERQTIQRLDISGQFGGTPNFMLAPLKEQLVEKYFHPDNISPSEKPKHELQKVRDEFKMSKSDCGSAHVQGNTF